MEIRDETNMYERRKLEKAGISIGTRPAYLDPTMPTLPVQQRLHELIEYFVSRQPTGYKFNMVQKGNMWHVYSMNKGIELLETVKHKELISALVNLIIKVTKENGEDGNCKGSSDNRWNRKNITYTCKCGKTKYNFYASRLCEYCKTVNNIMVNTGEIK